MRMTITSSLAEGMPVRISNTDRSLAVLVGWQAECAVQNASLYATRFQGIDPNITPTTFAACVELGRKMCRAFLAKIDTATRTWRITQ